MAEATGLAVGVVALASLFTTCIDCWEYFDNARVSDKQYELLATKLEVEKTRLLLWGDALHILDERPSDSLVKTPAVQAIVHRILACINMIFEDSDSLTKRYGLSPSDQMSIDAQEVKRLTLSARQMERFRSFKKRLQTSKRDETPSHSIMKGARWSIRDRQKFSDLVEHLRQYIDGLKAVTETSQGPRANRRAIYDEIQSLNDAADIEQVVKATEDVHQDWHDCATEVFEMSVLGEDDRAEIVGWLSDVSTGVNQEFSPADKLVADGFDVTNPNADQMWWAVAQNEPEVVQYLLDKGIHVDIRDTSEKTPLARSADDGYVSVARVLLAAGAEIETVQHGAQRPLGNAVWWQREAMVRFLLEEGAAVDGRGLHDHTPLTLAAGHATPNICEILLQSGADIEAAKPNGATALLESIHCDRPKNTILLLRRGARTDKTWDNGRNALISAAADGRFEMVKILVEHGGVDINQTVTKSGLGGRTALTWAVVAGSVEIVKYLLEQGADVDAMGWPSENPLVEAAWWPNRQRILRILFRYEPDINVVDPAQGSPLARCVKRGHKGSIDVLLQNGINVNQIDRLGCTAVFHAVRFGDLSMVRFLLSRGASLDLRSQSGDTILHHAIREKQDAIVRFLIRQGVDPKAEDRAGLTAATIAEASGRGNDEVVVFLRGIR